MYYYKTYDKKSIAEAASEFAISTNIKEFYSSEDGAMVVLFIDGSAQIKTTTGVIRTYDELPEEYSRVPASQAQSTLPNFAAAPTIVRPPLLSVVTPELMRKNCPDFLSFTDDKLEKIIYLAKQCAIAIETPEDLKYNGDAIAAKYVPLTTFELEVLQQRSVDWLGSGLNGPSIMAKCSVTRPATDPIKKPKSILEVTPSWVWRNCPDFSNASVTKIEEIIHLTNEYATYVHDKYKAEIFLGYDKYLEIATKYFPTTQQDLDMLKAKVAQVRAEQTKVDPSSASKQPTRVIHAGYL